MSETERLFEMCDRDGKGYLIENDLKLVCPQLDDNDIAFIFASLDSDGSGRIERDEFVSGFQRTIQSAESRGCNGLQRRASVVETVYETDEYGHLPVQSGSDYERRSRNGAWSDDNVYHSESDSQKIDFALPWLVQDEVLALYQQLQNAGVPQLLGKFERVVGTFCKEIHTHKEENERLQHVYESEREMYNRRMEEVESELDQQLVIAERKAREEERERLEREKDLMKRQMELEMREMKDNIERLQKMEKVLEREGQKMGQQKELQEKLSEVSSENLDLKRDLAENHLELAMIKSELAHTRADYDNKQMELLNQRKVVSMSTEETENMQRQLQLLFDANRKLHETNDSLRSVLDRRTSIVQQFNLRSDSPLYARETPSRVTELNPRALMTPTHSGFVTDEEVSADSGLAMGYETGSDMDEKPKGDVEPFVGLNAANGPAERTFRVVMCGDAAVGKSSLVMRIIKGCYTHNLPSTLGVDFHVKTVNADGRNVALQLWDTAGQERFRSLCKSYFRRADGAVLVYDCTVEQTFLRVRDWVDTIKEAVERPIPIILVANKTDRRISHGDAVPTREGAAMAAAMGVLFTETSALDGSNVEGAMLTLTRELMAIEDVEIRSTGVVLSKRPQQKSSCFSRPSCGK